MNTKKTAVLLVHGLRESPALFDFLIRALPEGTAYRNVQLPGHSGSLRDFRRCGRKAWEKSVRKAAVALGQEYDRVVFVGHGIGCLLGLITAQALEIRFSSMLLIACPFRLRWIGKYLKAGNPEQSVRIRHGWQQVLCLHPYREALGLIREVNRMNRKPRLRATAFFPEKDEIVSRKARIAARNVWRFADMSLPGCTHSQWTEEAQRYLQDALNVMIRSA